MVVGVLLEIWQMPCGSAGFPTGVANRDVAKVGGHSTISFNKGVTDEYIGEAEMDACTPRAEQIFIIKTLIIGNAFQKRRPTITTSIHTAEKWHWSRI